MRWLAPLFFILLVISFLINARDSESRVAPVQAPVVSEGSESATSLSALEIPEPPAACGKIEEANDSSFFLRTVTGLWRDDLAAANFDDSLMPDSPMYFESLMLSPEPSQTFTSKLFVDESMTTTRVVPTSATTRFLRVSRADADGFRELQLGSQQGCLALKLKLVFNGDGQEILLARDPDGTHHKYVRD